MGGNLSKDEFNYLMEAKVDRLSDTTIDQLVHRTSPMHGELLKHFSKKEHNICPRLIPPWYVVEVIHNIARKEQLVRLRFTENEDKLAKPEVDSARSEESDLQGKKLPSHAPPLSQADLQQVILGHFGALSRMEVVLELASGAHCDFLNQYFSREMAQIYPSFMMPHDICTYIEQKARIESPNILKLVSEREPHQSALEARQSLPTSELPNLTEISKLNLSENPPASEQERNTNPSAVQPRVLPDQSSTLEQPAEHNSMHTPPVDPSLARY
jgi:hypothetical protein